MYKNKLIEIDTLTDRLEELQAEWWEIVGPYLKADAGVEWFEPMPEEIEALDQDISDEIESLKIEIEALTAEVA